MTPRDGDPLTVDDDGWRTIVEWPAHAGPPLRDDAWRAVYPAIVLAGTLVLVALVLGFVAQWIYGRAGVRVQEGAPPLEPAAAQA
jgi:hypothetical protein